MSKHYSCVAARRYRVFLSSTFVDLKQLRQDVIQALSAAGLFYFAMEDLSGDSITLSKHLKAEIEDSDIFLLLVENYSGEFRIRGFPVTEFEFDTAIELGKPVLAYLGDDGSFGRFPKGDTTAFKEKVVKHATYSRRTNNPSLDIVADILRHICTQSDGNYWLRSKINKKQLRAAMDDHRMVADQLDRVANNLLYQIFERRFRLAAPHAFDQVIGPLLDLGLVPTISDGQPVHFLKKIDIQGEMIRTEMECESEYCMQRFARVGVDLILDRRHPLLWYHMQNENFSWQEAVELCKRGDIQMSESTRGALGAEDPHWRLPSIAELMTLMTAKKNKDYYFDTKAFDRVKDDVSCFWSSTCDDQKSKAFYIEAQSGDVLMDPISSDDEVHKKGLILCADVGDRLQKWEVIHPDGNASAALNVDFNASRRIFSIYLSDLAQMLDMEDARQTLRRKLSLAQYDVKTFEDLRASVGSQGQAIENQMALSDFHVLILDDSLVARGDTWRRKLLKLEIEKARELDVPTLLFHRLGDLHQQTTALGLDIGSMVPAYINRVDELPSMIQTWITQEAQENTPSGWVRASFEQEMIESLKRLREDIDRLEQAADLLEGFVHYVNDAALRKSFQRLGVLPRKPGFGSQVYFASFGQPFENFRKRDGEAEINWVPIHYKRIDNRFKPLSRNAGLAKQSLPIVLDTYLDRVWDTNVVKGLTYAEAVQYVNQRASNTGIPWRLPSLEETLTLHCKNRGQRKYMDELVFPKGRWFWVESELAKSLMFVDFNFQYGAFGEEPSDLDFHAQPNKMKSVLLICDDINAEYNRG